MRPDLSGAIVMTNKKWNRWDIIKAVPTGECIPEETLEWLKEYAVEHKIPLLFLEYEIEDGKLVRTRQLGYGPPDFAHAVKTEITPHDITRF